MGVAIALSTAKQCSASRGEALRRRVRGRLGAGVAVVMLLGGCARESETALPAACSASPDAVRAALRDAPGEVRIDGTAISACFDDTSDSGEVQQVGAAYLSAAAELSSAAAAADPGGPEAVQLAYLVGAVRRGASRSQGIHYELARRLEQELDGLGRQVPAVREALRAGREHG